MIRIGGIAPLLSTSLPNVAVYGLLGMLGHLVILYGVFDKTRDFISSAGGYYSQESFDIVIVGAGSAGSVLANRLSRKFKVLVLEAGGQPNPLLEIPILQFPLTTHAEFDWMYYTVPQTNACLGLHGHRSYWPRGKAEGGSSNLNAMIYLRGHPNDFNVLAKNLEDPLWTYQNVVNFYKTFEDFKDNNPNHGHGGEQRVEFGSYDGLIDAYIKAGRELGYPVVDLNFYHDEGFAPLTFTSKKGMRFEDYLAFLKPAKNSPTNRLSVYKYSKVLRVLLDKNKKAYGVEYRRYGILRRAYVSKEVIISAGVINSPQILMLSGIGRRALLNSLRIPVISDLPVGENLQDHVGTIMGMFAIDQPLTTAEPNSIGSGIATGFEYLLRGTGLISSTLVKAVGSVTSDYKANEPNSSRALKWPDIQLTLIGASQPSFYEPLLNFFNIHPNTVQNLWSRTAGQNTFQIFMINARPQQRGEVKIISSDPDFPPLIDPKYLQNERDVKVSVEGIKLGVKLVNSTNAFRKIGGKLLNIPLEPCANYLFGSDTYWECYLRHLTMTL